ncbi:MAG: archaellin/type IV pilin N-terminal domain-containing protein [Nanobdellota archaeon]
MDTESVFRNKRALSTVIATVLIILLVVVSVTIVWTFVKNMVDDNLNEEAQTCLDLETTDKVALNGYYTCYNTTATPGEVQFSISLKDVQIDSLIISIAMDGNSQSFTLTNNATSYENLRPYTGNFNDPVQLPGKNAGKTYSASGFTGTKVDSIIISPVVGGKQCGATSQMYQVVDCRSLE